MKRGSFPFKYLGVPLFASALRRQVLQPTFDMVLSKFQKWKGKSLSLLAQLCLVKSTIYGSLIHSFKVYRWPFNLIWQLERLIRNFIWTSSTFGKKSITVSWEKVCKPFMVGCLGLQRLSVLNDALLSKLAWSTRYSPRLSVFFGPAF